MRKGGNLWLAEVTYHPPAVVVVVALLVEVVVVVEVLVVVVPTLDGVVPVPESSWNSGTLTYPPRAEVA